MLQRIHEKITGWFANVIMIVLAVAFALWGIQYYLEDGGHRDDVAKVNGKAISFTELNAAYSRLKDEFSKNGNQSFSADQQEMIKQQALQQIINTQVLSDAARKQNFRISPDQVDDVILQIPAFQENGNFSPLKFQNILASMSYSQQQFLIDLENTLLVNQMQSGIVDSSFGLPNEASNAQTLFEQKRDIAYAIIPAKEFLSRMNVTDAQIQQYYQQHQNDFSVPEKLRVEYLELSADQIAKNIKVNEQETKQYYSDNLSSFTEHGKTLNFDAVKDKVIKILQRQKVQQIFSDQSQKLSDTTYSNSGSLTTAATALGLKIQTSDFFTRQGTKEGITANPQVVTVAFNDDVLKNRNNSNLITIKDGDVVVLRVKDYEPAGVKPLNDVINVIKNQLQQEMAQQAAKNQGDTDINSDAKLNWQYRDNVARTTKNIPPQILQAAFDLSPAEKTGVTLPNGDYALVSVKKISNLQPKVSQNSAVYLNQIANSYGQLEFGLLVNQIISGAKIKIYQQI